MRSTPAQTRPPAGFSTVSKLSTCLQDVGQREFVEDDEVDESDLSDFEVKTGPAHQVDSDHTAKLTPRTCFLSQEMNNLKTSSDEEEEESSEEEMEMEMEETKTKANVKSKGKSPANGSAARKKRSHVEIEYENETEPAPKARAAL